MSAMDRTPDPIRRPGLATATATIAGTWSASIAGSDWPTRPGSDRPVLDRVGSGSTGWDESERMCTVAVGQARRARGPSIMAP